MIDNILDYFPDCEHIELRLTDKTEEKPFCKKRNEFIWTRPRKCWTCFCEGGNE